MAGSTWRQSQAGGFEEEAELGAVDGEHAGVGEEAAVEVEELFAERTTEKPPRFMLGRKSSRRGGRRPVPGWSLMESSRVGKRSLGRRPTSSANMQKRQRMRKLATRLPGWPCCFEDLASSARWRRLRG
jgi:hypothetical protein